MRVPHPFLVDASGVPLMLDVPDNAKGCARCAIKTANGITNRGHLGKVVPMIVDKITPTRDRWNCTRCDFEMSEPTSASSTPSSG